MADPANYVLLKPKDVLSSTEPSLLVVANHYRKKGCTIYKAGKPKGAANQNSLADFIVVCDTGDGKCVAIIEVKDGASDCKKAMEQVKESIKRGADAGLIDPKGQNPSVSVIVFNGTKAKMKDEESLVDAEVGKRKAKVPLVTEATKLPC